MGIPTHIKQQNNNNNIKKITFDMCAPPRFCTQLWALQRYFCLFVILSGLESTTLKPIYWFWANGVLTSDNVLGLVRGSTTFYSSSDFELLFQYIYCLHLCQFT